MMRTTHLLAALVPWILTTLAQDMVVSPTVPSGSAGALPEGFVSYSVELDAFPSWIGSPSSPNAFTNNLLANIQNSQVSMPYIRIGGGSADSTNYNASQQSRLHSNGDSAPFKYTIGPPYLEYYKTYNTSISQGLNLASLLGDDAAAAQSSLEAWSKAACAILGPQLNVLELGNEPDSYIKENLANSSYTTEVYDTLWKSAAKSITDLCPAFKTAGFMGPSIANTESGWIISAFEEGLNSDKNIAQVSIHSYMASKKTAATNTLQNTLMNHQTIDDLISTLLYFHKQYEQYTPNTPIILGETNSISEGGQAGLSDVFGAALWAFDYLLYAAARGFRRVNFHQASLYAAWVDIGTTTAPPLTRPVYYGHLAAASMIGNDAGAKQIVSLPLTDQYEAAYAAYTDGKLRRLAAVNLVQFNQTQKALRGSRDFTFKVGNDEEWTVMRLKGKAADSNSTGTTTFNNVACEYNTTAPGVCVKKSPDKESWYAKNGTLTISIPDSEAVVMYVHGFIY